MTDVTVLVVDDQRLVREGISSLLEIQEGIHVLSTATDGQQAVEQALALVPDVILMDVRMPVMDGIEATLEIQQKLPNCRVLMLKTFNDDDYIVKSLLAGASGYLLKDMPAINLAQAVKLTHAGIYQLDETVAGKLLNAVTPGAARQPEPVKRARDLADLTKRETEVLELIATGATNREIAEQLVVSEGTIKNHVSNILSRLGLRDRIQAAIYAYEHGLVDPKPHQEVPGT